MQIQFRRGIVLLVAVFLSISAHAGLAPQESAALQSISKSCANQRHRADDFMRRHPANSTYNEAMLKEALALLKHPTLLPPAYWTIRYRINSLPIRDITSGRDFSAMDGRLGQTELSCSGSSDSQILKLIADKAATARKADPNFRKRFTAVWKSWLAPQLSQPMSYPQYIQIVETAKHLAKRRLMDVPRPISDSIRQMDAKIHQTVPTKPMPLISNPQDPKWTDWGKMSQAKSRKERELIPSAQKALSALTK
jgi:hypothetical protein